VTAELIEMEEGEEYAIEMTKGEDTIRFECITKAGLVSAFSLNGDDMLIDSRVNRLYGSTFWPSPQSAWDGSWPPPGAIDPLDYPGGEYEMDPDFDGVSITLTSEVDADYNLQVVKKFTADLENFAIDLEYTLRSTSGTQRWAPWEITRVYPEGLTFFPMGSGSIATASGNQPLKTTEDANGIVWFEHTESAMSDDPVSEQNYKVYTDGSDGWMANARDDLLFVKKFEDIGSGDSADGHGEIEIYCLGMVYQEMEQQGAEQSIGSGNEIVWNVKWYLRSVPDDAAVEVGNEALVAFAAGLPGI
jgi:hypothetical protein